MREFIQDSISPSVIAGFFSSSFRSVDQNEEKRERRKRANKTRWVFTICFFLSTLSKVVILIENYRSRIYQHIQKLVPMLLPTFKETNRLIINMFY